jgi:NADPH:quinone reductase-like Zn-dependent oxidoreductase
MIFGKHLSIIGSTMAPRADFEAVMALIFAGKLKAVIDRVMPLADAAEAETILEKGENFGKMVLTP